MLMCFDQTFTCRVLAYWSITYTHVTSIRPNTCQIFRPDVVMQFRTSI